MEKLMHRLIWNDKTRGQVRKLVNNLQKEEGGMALPDLELLFATQRIGWFKRLLESPEGLWQRAMSFKLSKCVDRVLNTGKPGNPFTQPSIKKFSLPSPWPETVDAWRKFGGGLRDPTYLDEALEQPLRRNEFLEYGTMPTARRCIHACAHMERIGDWFD
jgi:hypothetical protein